MLHLAATNLWGTILMNTFGMSVPVYALVFGITSGLALPCGACMGLYFSPVSDALVAAMMSLGAGALLFAVTVEIYGKSLRQLALGDKIFMEMCVTMIGALCGALFYLSINRWIEGRVGSSPVDEETPFSPTGTDRTGSTALRTAKDRWKAISKTVSVKELLRREHLVGLRGREKALRTLAVSTTMSFEDDEEELRIKRGRQVALSLFMGILIDGVPEGILMGFLAAEGHLTIALICSLFMANFPEAFSSASLSKQAGMPTYIILTMWTSLCLLTGCLCGLSCWLMLKLYPDFGTNPDQPYQVALPVAFIEGLTGGAMIACISAVMLPEAFKRCGADGPIVYSSGFLCPCGFLVAVLLKSIGG